MQPLETKKNQTTFKAEKITQHRGTKDNHPASWDKKITKPLGTKKIMLVFRTKQIM